MASPLKILPQPADAPSCRIEILGEILELLPERALYWPSRKTLLVADLHWGKDEAFRVRGHPLPEGVLTSDLARLTRCLVARPVEQVYVLGDLIHNRDGMSATIIESVSEWRIQNPIPIRLAPGNHDRHFPSLPDAWQIECIDPTSTLGPFTLVHDPTEQTTGYAIGGHIHPLHTIHGRNDRITLPCFYFGPQFAILPAFSEFTGGQKIDPTPDAVIFLLTDQRILPLQR